MRFIVDNAIVIIVNAIHILQWAFQYVNSTCGWVSAIVPLGSDLTIDLVRIVVEPNASLYIASDKIILIKSQIAIYNLTDIRVCKGMCTSINHTVTIKRLIIKHITPLEGVCHALHLYAYG